jgi:cobalt/nickel transport protein
LAGGAALAHFHTYWPDSPNGYGKLGAEVRWQYFWGHPYEYVIFDAEEPECYAVTPEGDRQPLALEPTELRDPGSGRVRRSYSWSYTPRSIGDIWIVVEAPPYLIEEEGEAVQDYVKQCLHVMAEDGWDRRLELPIELVPLTRPYGLEEGFAFTARAFMDGEPLAGAAVEIEKFNGFHLAAGDLPKGPFGNEDVPMITRTAKTDKDGYVTYTLDEEGWWMVSVAARSGSAQIGDEQYPLTLRGGLWVYVNEETSVGE